MFRKNNYKLIEQDGILRVSPLPDENELAQWYKNQYYPHASSTHVDEDRPLPAECYNANMSSVTIEALKQITGKDPVSNYHENKEFDSVANSLRVQLTDALVKQSTSKALNLFQSFLKMVLVEIFMLLLDRMDKVIMPKRSTTDAAG